MNIALIIAGGNGLRMGQDVPKQFLSVDDIPIIVYTLKAFEQHPEIASIVVVCVDGWCDVLKAYAKQFEITKLRYVVPGGATGQESIMNGVDALRAVCKPDDIVVIHDAIRPMVTHEIISDCINTCQRYGTAVTAIPCAEAMLTTADGVVGDGVHDRDRLKRTQTPQAFPLGTLCWAHTVARERGIHNSIATCTLMIELGRTVRFSHGSERNIKLTTLEDVDIFKALLKAARPAWTK